MATAELSTRSFAALLKQDEVPFEELRRKYYAEMRVTRVMIGVAPNVEKLFAIWPTALNTYNLMVPAFLGVPSSLFQLSTPLATRSGKSSL
mmetsp:Transcript_9661/g.29340  ORF Transcript_9661/g.29340 Transcript_9661/m.29340 type:complete len:91 (-) Transcript_9661:1269-1541(-)